MEIEDLIAKCKRDINLLISQVKVDRESGYKNLDSQFSPDKNNDLIKLQDLFENHMLKNLLQGINWPHSTTRELALKLILKAINVLPLISQTTSELLLNRLLQKIAAETKDTSEEVRKLIMEVIYKYLEKYPSHFRSGFLPFDQFIIKSLSDSFNDIKVKSCLILRLASDQLKEYVGEHAETILKELTKMCTHNVNNMRLCAVETVTSVLLTPKGGAYFGICYPYIRSLTKDKYDRVREATYTCVARLLMGFSLSNLELHEPHLILLMTCGMSDLNVDIQKKVFLSLEEAGEKRQMLEEAPQLIRTIKFKSKQK